MDKTFKHNCNLVGCISSLKGRINRWYRWFSLVQLIKEIFGLFQVKHQYLLHIFCSRPQLYGKRAVWEDPSKWVNDTYPWNAALLQQEGQSLLQLRPEDVGYDGYSSSKEGASSKQVSQSDTEGDPLVRTDLASYGSVY